MRTLQEENASLKAAADRAPTAGKLAELEKQISKPPSLVPSPTPSFSSLAVRYHTASDEKLGVGLGTRL